MYCNRRDASLVRFRSDHVVSEYLIDILRSKRAAADGRPRPHRPALAWLLAASVLALGTTEALSAARHKAGSSAGQPQAASSAGQPQAASSDASAKPASAHRKKVAAAARKK